MSNTKENTAEDIKTVGSNSPPSVAPVVHEELIEAVRKQIEYYFSKENLQTDAYLNSQMDAQMSVPISVVMKFSKLKNLTQDEAILREALVNSPHVTVLDNNRIKANFKSSGKGTIILRDIPSDAPEDEVREIFNYDGSKSIVSIRSEIGNTWFVVMETEEEAKDTLLDLRLKKRLFRGQSVKCRLKTESIVRSFYPIQQAPPIAPIIYSQMPFPGYMAPPIPIDLRAFGYMPPAMIDPMLQVPIVPNATTSPNKIQSVDGTIPTNNAVAEKSQSEEVEKANKESRDRKPRQQSNGTNGREFNNNNRDGAKKDRDINNKKQSKTKKEKEAEVNTPTIEINVVNFPPLSQAEIETPIPTPGYKQSFIKYSFDDIIGIVKQVKEASLPSTLDPLFYPLAMNPTPNLDLLLRQRTFSIDETREQLRQGRPVQRDAIITGNVDFHSYVFGDESNTNNLTNNNNQNINPADVQIKSIESKSTEIKISNENSKPTTSELNSNGQIFVPQGLTVEQATPKKITPGSWAAMVKSSAAATESSTTTKIVTSTVSNNIRTTEKSKTITKLSSTDSSSKKLSNESSNNGNNKTEKKSDRKRSGDKNKGNENKINSQNETSSNTNGTLKDSKVGDDKPAEQSQVTKDLTVVGLDVNPTEKAVELSIQPPPTSTGAAWGGKLSFANIVKQNSDDGTASHVTPSTVAPPTTTAPTTKVSSNGPIKPTNGKTNTDNKTSNDKKSSHSSHSKRSSSGANANGVWVKETLPALQGKQKERP
eukprot:gene7194-9812_t